MVSKNYYFRIDRFIDSIDIFFYNKRLDLTQRIHIETGRFGFCRSFHEPNFCSWASPIGNNSLCVVRKNLQKYFEMKRE